MKTNKKPTLRVKMMTVRDAADRECEVANEAAEAEAQAEFERGEVAEYFRENAGYITGLAVKRMEAVKKGEPTFPFRLFDAETMARLLSANTVAEYTEKGYDDRQTDAELQKAMERGLLLSDRGVMTTTTPTTLVQMRLRLALLSYVKEAASYAKRIASASLVEWAEIIDILTNRSGRYSTCCGNDDAVRIIELEKSAADRLRLDKIISELK